MQHDIRRLTETDTPLMRELLSVFSQAFEDVDAYIGQQSSNAFLVRLLNGDSFVALVAVAEGHAVGGLAAYGLKNFERERSEFWICDLADFDSHRRTGPHIYALAAARSYGIPRPIASCT